MVTPSVSTPKSESVQNQNSTDELKIESLFNFTRGSSGWKLFFLCVYFPVGLILAVLRLFIGLHVFVLSIFLRRSQIGRRILRFMCIILGFVVAEKGEQDPVRIVIVNHISPFDFFAIALTRSCVLPSSWDLPEALQRMFGVRNLGIRAGRDTLVKNAKAYCASDSAAAQPLVTFPEGTMTKGTTGLLKFNNWPFSLDFAVQPVVIRTWRPAFIDVALTTVGSGLLADTFWFLCVPFTMFELIWLPAMNMEKGETADAFTRKVEKAIADTAGVKTTNFTSHDAFEFAKRHLMERAARANGHGGRAPHAYDQLAARVKEIVPQVPLSVILNDLERTGGSVDITMANILEGRVSYTPESPQSVSSAKMYQKTMPKVSTNDPSSWRELYDARKQEMLETHRRKYLEKKGYLLRSSPVSSTLMSS